MACNGTTGRRQNDFIKVRNFTHKLYTLLNNFVGSFRVSNEYAMAADIIAPFKALFDIVFEGSVPMTRGIF